MKATYTVSNNNVSVNNNGSSAKIENGDNAAPIEGSVSKFRTIFPQILASSAKNLLLIDLGLAVAFPTIVIPVLRGLQDERNPDEILSFSAIQASWYGSIAYICQPVGSILSGLVAEPIGRKKAMILVNIPHIIAWVMLYLATSLEEIFIAGVLLGLGVGFMEAPIVTYVGEISQPSIRGILTSCAGIAAMLGFMIVYTLGTVLQWRTVALCCLSVPVTTMVAICFVPETPMWLLSKNRNDDALKSLQWLRGWVPPKVVEKEFTEIKNYSEQSNACVQCQKDEIKCVHPKPTLVDKLKELLRKRTIKPFLLVGLMFFFSQFTGLTPIRPYMVQIFTIYDLPIDPNWATSVISIMGLIASIICTCVIGVLGKRKLYLFSMSGTALCCIALGVYAYNIFPSEWSSFDKHDPIENLGNIRYFPMVLFFGLAFFTSVGVAPIAWILLCEVFPFKSRGFATGITAGINYMLTFVSIKTYLNFEDWFSLYGVMFLYGSIAIIGAVVMYLILPETENRKLEDIELYFTDNNRKITDIKIPCAADMQKQMQLKNEMKTNTSSIGCDNKAFA